MSARTEPCGEFAILTATLSLSYALRILFLYRVLYVFKGLAPTCAYMLSLRNENAGDFSEQCRLATNEEKHMNCSS